MSVLQLRRRYYLTTGFVYAHLIEDIFLRLKFTEFRETRFDNMLQLNFKCFWWGTFEIKLIVVMASDDVNNERHRHRKRFGTALGHHTDIAAFEMLDGLLKNISKWNLNFELLEQSKMEKERDYQVIPLGHFIYWVLDINKISIYHIKNTDVFSPTVGLIWQQNYTWN